MTAVTLGLLAQWGVRRARAEQAFLTTQLAGRTDTPGDVEKVAAEELLRGAEFARLAEQRMRRDLPVALAIPDGLDREAAVQALLERERYYARLRAEAMAARATAAVDRMVLRRESPTGAFWELDPDVIEHTAGCLILGGRFWPWAVLDRVHPPRHAGCPCRLRSYGEAVKRGLLVPGTVLDEKAAIKAASAVVMESEAFLAEFALIEAGGIVGFAQRAFDEAQHPRDQAGRWRETVGSLSGGGWRREGGVTFKDSGHGAISVQGPGGRGGMAFTQDGAVKMAEQAVADAAKAPKEKADGLEDPGAFAKVFDGFEHGGIKVKITSAERTSSSATTSAPSVGARGTEVSGDLIADGKVVGFIVRNIALTESGLGGDLGLDPAKREGGLWVYHHELRLDPEYQRRGFATALNEHSEKAYRAAGVREVRTTAMDSGTAVWAKRGFEPLPTVLENSPEKVVQGWATKVDILEKRMGPTSAAELAELRKLLAAGDVGKVAASAIGERFLTALGSFNGRKQLKPKGK